jgi:two-component system OmpR family response regulator
MTLGSQNLNTSSPPVRQPQESLTPLASILVVEDEAGVRNLMVQLLQMGGYAAIAVDNGLDAISSFKTDHYGLVFTDFRMEGISGAEVTRALKAYNSQIPVVVVTGWDPDTVREELEGAGVDHIRQKPFDMDDMLQLVPSLTA